MYRMYARYVRVFRIDCQRAKATLPQTTAMGWRSSSSDVCPLEDSPRYGSEAPAQEHR